MTLQRAEGLWRPDVAAAALDQSRPVAPLQLPWAVDPYEVQIRGIAWLWAVPRSILGDVTGLGKTIIMLGLILMLKATGELQGRKTILVAESGAVGQLAGEFSVKAPTLNVAAIEGGTDRKRRKQVYRRPWDVLIIGYPTMWRDAALLSAEQAHLVLFDESTNFANPETRTAQGARTISAHAARIHPVTATPVAMGIQDLFSPLQVTGLAGVSGTLFGNQFQYEQRYLIARHQSAVAGPAYSAQKTIWSPNKATLPEFREKLSPFYLRRNEGTADMPAVMPPEDVWLTMGKEQADRYALIRNSGEAAGSRFQRQMMAATTLANLGEADISAKFDWFMEQLVRRYVDEDGAPEKVVVFLANVAAVEALRKRLAAAGWGAALITGEHKRTREQERQRFWDDPSCRVAIGTRAIEKSLNLQVSRWAVMLDLLTNPARMEQFLGRVKRTNSRFSHVHLQRVMMRNTSEEGLLRVTRERQHLADYIHQDESDIFRSIAEADPGAAQAILNFGS